MNKILLLVFFFFCTRISKVLLLAHNKEERNFFRDINIRVQNTINKIFVLLHLNKNFTADYNNRILLTLHAYMKTISEKKCKGYRNVKRAAKISLKHNFKDGINEHDNLTSLLVRKILTPSNVMKYSDQVNKTGINLPLTSIEIPEKWGDSLKFLKDFFKDNIEETKPFSIDTRIHLRMLRNRRKKKDYAKPRQHLLPWKAINASKVINNGTDTRRVYKGESVNINMFPFIASIHVNGEFVCAGSIVSKDMIITAATCLHVFLYNKNVSKDNPKGVQVRVGSEYTQKIGNVHGVSQIYFHPRYNVENLHNNLAILRLDQSLHLKSKKIRRIAYQRWKDDNPEDIQEVLMLGWGDKEPEVSGMYDALAYASLKTFDQGRCMETYSRKYVSNKNFCAGYRHKGSGACQRDVGGPAVVGDVLVGIVSFGPPVCGSPDAPTVFMNIGYYSKWIDSVVIKKSSDITPTLLKSKHHESIVMRHLKEPTEKSMPDHKERLDMVPRSQLPKAINILKIFLKKLTGGGNNLNDMLYEANDDLDEGSDEGIVVDVDDNEEEEEERPLKQDTEVTQMRKGNKDNFDNNDKVTIINADQVVKNVVNGLRSEFIKSKKSSGSEDPLFLAIKSLGNYLGLDKFVRLPDQARYRSNQMIEHPDELEEDESQNQDTTSSASSSIFHLTTATGELETDSLENTFRTKSIIEATASTINIADNIKQNKHIKSKENGNIFSPEESDNYESDSQGMSIELKEMEPIQRAQTEKNDAATIAIISYGTQIPEEYHDKAQVFLNKNFIKDINALPANLNENYNNEELLVLLLKTTTQNPEILKNIADIEIPSKQRVIKASRFSVISSFNSSLKLEDRNDDKSKLEIEVPFNVVQPIFNYNLSNAQLRSVNEDENKQKSSVLLTTESTVTTDIPITNIDLIHSTVAYNLTTTKLPLLVNTPTTIRTYITTKAPVVITSNTVMTNTETHVVTVDNPYNTTDIKADESTSTATIAKVTMAAYEVDDEENDDEDDDGDIDDFDDTDVDFRKVIDYINIT